MMSGSHRSPFLAQLVVGDPLQRAFAHVGIDRHQIGCRPGLGVLPAQAIKAGQVACRSRPAFWSAASAAAPKLRSPAAAAARRPAFRPRPALMSCVAATGRRSASPATSVCSRASSRTKRLGRLAHRQHVRRIARPIAPGLVGRHGPQQHAGRDQPLFAPPPANRPDRSSGQARAGPWNRPADRAAKTCGLSSATEPPDSIGPAPPSGPVGSPSSTRPDSS